MKLSEFIEAFIVALYHYSEAHGVDYCRAGEIVEIYGLPYKESWGTVIFDDYNFSMRVKSARNIGSFNHQAVMIAAEGIRWVEDEIGDENVTSFLEQHGLKNPAVPKDDLAVLSTQIAPAADRLVNLSHNQQKREEIIAEIRNVGTALSGSNTLDPQEKSDVLANLSAAEALVENSDTWFAGAMQYLVFDRIRKAFEKTIEDAIRLAIIGFLAALAVTIMALV